MLNSCPVRRAATSIAVAVLFVVVFSLVVSTYECDALCKTKKLDESRLVAGWLNIAFVGASGDYRVSSSRRTAVNYEIFTQARDLGVSPTIDTTASTTILTPPHTSASPSASLSKRPTLTPFTGTPSTPPASETQTDPPTTAPTTENPTVEPTNKVK